MSRLADIPISADLIAGARREDPAAQATIYRALAPAAFALIRRLVGNRAVAEDVFQDAMLALFQRLEDFRGEAPLGAWLRQIAVSRCPMYWRSPWHRARLHWDSGDDGPLRSPMLPVTPAGSADAIDIERALASLTPTGRAQDTRAFGSANVMDTANPAQPAATADRLTQVRTHALIGVQLGGKGDQAGARIREVRPGGPALRAGVRAGDLIVAVNGTDVRGADPGRRVVELLRGVDPGEKVDLRVARAGKTRDFTVTAGPDIGRVFGGAAVRLPDLPAPSLKALAAWGGGPMIIRGPVADMELARLTPGLGRYFGTDAGVLVVRAPPDGALGLQDGDVILSIGGRKPIDSSHVIRILASYDPGEKITLEVMRQHRKVSVATTLPAEPGMPRRVLMIRTGQVRSGPAPWSP